MWPEPGAGAWFPQARLRGNAALRAGCRMLVALALAGLVGPFLDSHDPSSIDPAHALERPGLEFPFGADHLGRCVLSRLLHGARWSLGLSMLATALVVALGTSVGAVSGQIGGLLDSATM